MQGAERYRRWSGLVRHVGPPSHVQAPTWLSALWLRDPSLWSAPSDLYVITPEAVAATE